jgi:hypothetical protein
MCDWRRRLDDWQLIGPITHSWLDQGAELLSRISETVALAAILLPVVIAVFSKRIIIVLGCLLLSIISFYVFVAPSNMAKTLALGVYLGGLIVALSGIASHRKAKYLHVQLERLRRNVNDLMAADERRLLSELKSFTDERRIAGRTIATSEDPPA